MNYEELKKEVEELKKEFKRLKANPHFGGDSSASLKKVEKELSIKLDELRAIEHEYKVSYVFKYHEEDRDNVENFTYKTNVSVEESSINSLEKKEIKDILDSDKDSLTNGNVKILIDEIRRYIYINKNSDFYIKKVERIK